MKSYKTQAIPGEMMPARDVALLKQGHVKKADYFYFETRPDIKQPLAIVFGGYEVCEVDFEIRRNAYPYYILELGLKGLCRLTINNTEHKLTSGVLAGFSPRSSHHYRCDSLAPFEHYFVAFTGTESRELFSRSTIASNGSVLLEKSLFAVFEQIMRHGMEKNRYSQQICTSYLRILLLSLSGQSVFAPSSQPLSAQTYDKCRKFIDDNFSIINSPSQAAGNCGINIRYMSRLFKRFGSVTPHEYILRLKLNKAANMLLTTSMPVNAVAEHIGFADPYHFSRNFTRFHGLSPLKYRKLHMI